FAEIRPTVPPIRRGYPSPASQASGAHGGGRGHKGGSFLTAVLRPAPDQQSQVLPRAWPADSVLDALAWAAQQPADTCWPGRRECPRGHRSHTARPGLAPVPSEVGPSAASAENTGGHPA